MDNDNLKEFKKWLESRGYSPTTIQNLCINLKSIAKKLGLQVTKEQVREAYWIKTGTYAA